MGPSRGTILEGELFGECEAVFMPLGRHFKTASTEALQGWTWRGYENMTRITIAALAIVDTIEGMSEKGQLIPAMMIEHLHIPTIFPATAFPNDK